MNEHQIQIEKFFKQDSFSAKDLNKLWKRVRSNSKKNELEVLHSQIKEELKAYIKNGKSYKKHQNRVLTTESRKRNDELINKFLTDNLNSTNSELANNLKLNFNQLAKIVKTFEITKFEKEGFLSEAEKETLTDFFDSRLIALNRIKSARKKKNETDKRKKKLKEKSKRKKSIGSAGVYDKIKERGGIGKLIYNAMKK